MHDFAGILAVAAVVIGVRVIFYWQHARSRSLIAGGAAQNRFEVLTIEARYLRKGPFFWTSSNAQTIYSITVRDDQNQIRSGWVRCGGGGFGLCSNRTEGGWKE